MPWSRGQSGNPGGRPKALAEVVTLARAETAANIAALVRVRDDRNSPPAAVVAASTALLDRAWGKPTQPLAGDADQSPIHYCFEWADATPDATPIALASVAAASEDEARTELVLQWGAPGDM